MLVSVELVIPFARFLVSLPSVRSIYIEGLEGSPMSSRHLASGDEDERGRAVRRLQAAVAERGRARDAQEPSAGSVEADTSLRAADDEVAARERWLHAVDDHY
jgi:hypothetical protein